MDFRLVEKNLQELNCPSYRIGQVRQAVFKDGVSQFEEMKTLPKELRRALSEKVPMLSFVLERVLVSKDGKAHKALVRLKDGQPLETVLLNPKPGLWSCCISSQAGCALACTFCATGLMGFKRNLSAEEITDQVLFWRQYMKKEGMPGRLENVVYMGMGEPFLNFEALSQSIGILTDPELFGFGHRHLSVSTAGVAPAIEKFGKYFPQVNLALSLHAAENQLRSSLVPLNKAYPLEKLAESLKRYFHLCRRKVFLEYILLKGVNDGKENALDLVRYLRSIRQPERLHVNLIVFNPTDTPYRPSSPGTARDFKQFLQKHGILSTIRKNLGLDIEGACGQLAGK